MGLVHEGSEVQSRDPSSSGLPQSSFPCWAEAPARHRAEEGPDLEERAPRHLSPPGVKGLGRFSEGTFWKGALRDSGEQR